MPAPSCSQQERGTMWTVIKVILQIVLWAFVALNVFMKGKPIHALVLFVRDFVHMDKRQFRGYGFWLYCGLGGSGKTVSMVEYLIRMKRKYPKVKVYTNFDFALADGKITSWQDIINFDNGDNGVIFGFDEIHLTFASQKWADCPDNMLEYISQQRKLHKQIVATSQVFTRINKQLREQTNYVIECSSLLLGRLIFNKAFHTADYLANEERGDNGAHKRKRAWRYSFVATDAIRKKYDTMQIMVDLRKPKTQQAIALDTLKEQLGI